jgi:methylated-DNA-[protein]-cysteine S-methyltransferase
MGECTMPSLTLDSPVGPLCVTETDGAITALGWGGAGDGEETGLLAEARRQIDAYFAGTRRAFDLPLRVAGSDFQRAVCAAMLAIPFGETRTYGEIAGALGASAQAVGHACGANPIPLIIPCHRVLGAASLGGYSGAGGIETKVALLRLEGAGGLLI